MIFTHRIQYKKIPILLLCLLGLSLCYTGYAQNGPSQRYPLIPYPQILKPEKGVFIMTTRLHILVKAPKGSVDQEVEQLQQLVKQATGHIPTITTRPTDPLIVLEADSNLQHPEAYRLEIGPRRIVVAARSGTGMFRGIETLRQLMPVLPSSTGRGTLEPRVPAVKIRDYPVYAWRGIHLDVARHFFSTAYLKKLLDLMALYKFNKLHLHLTDDQGWRIEIKKYPLLTREGAWRSFNSQDSDCIRLSKDNPDMAIDPAHIIHRNGQTLYGGFYTQEQMRDLIAYAGARHIDIIPEIDMPGHMMAAIREYPYLACNSKAGWGKTFSTPICPCKDSTFRFAEDVFSEIAALFPSPYIHLGADEVEKTSWSASADCQAVMKANGLTGPEELQSYFVRRMEKFFNSKGKKLIGWDEILEGGVTASAIVMYWRSWIPDAPVTAARNGNKVIMTPGNPLYFDRQPDAHSLEEVYRFDPVPRGLDPQAAANIIGAQANLWTEHVPSEARADYMYMPRMTALAEVLWTHRRDFNGFMARLGQQYPRLDRLKVQYRLPDLQGFAQQNAFTDSAVLDVHPPSANLTLHYTVNGRLPGRGSPVLRRPLVIRRPVTIKLAAFTPAGRRGDIYTLAYEKQPWSAAEAVTGLRDGLQLSFYKGFFRNTREIKAEADTTLRVASPGVPDSLGKGSFGLKYRGYIRVPEKGIYNFYFTCDDGGVLWIDGRLVVDNDGLHAPLQKSGSLPLKKGLHRFALDFIEGGGGYTLDLKYSLPGQKPVAIPLSWWQAP